MDRQVTDAARKYVADMLSRGDKGNEGVQKALLLDDDTKNFISLVFTQSQLLERNVFLVDHVSKHREPVAAENGKGKGTDHGTLKHMRAIVFIRPPSYKALEHELEHGNFKEYYLYFSNIIPTSDLESLAQFDKHDLVKEVHEYFLDYYAMSRNLFSLELDAKQIYTKSPKFGWDKEALDRCTTGLASVLLSMKCRPLIRYEQSSDMSKELARRLQNHINGQNSLFSFKETPRPPVLFILDRRNDPFTPLLSQWTYQAMVHELIGIKLNVVSFKTDGNEKKDLVLSSDDTFFETYMFRHLGDVGTEAKRMLDDLTRDQQRLASGTSLQQMKEKMMSLPKQLTEKSLASKHISILLELTAQYKKQKLLEVSEVEQNIVCAGDHSVDVKAVEKILDDTGVSKENKLRVVLLYALRHESVPNNSIGTFTSRLSNLGVGSAQLERINSVLKYAGNGFRQAMKRPPASVFAAIANSFFSNANDNDLASVITQHKSVMYETIDNMLHGKLADASFPFQDNSTSQIPQQVVVFFIGGVTCEEAKHAADLSSSGSLKMVVGGTTLLNSKIFLDEVDACT